MCQPVELSTKGWLPGSTSAAELTSAEGCHVYRVSKAPSFRGETGDAVQYLWGELPWLCGCCTTWSAPAPRLLRSKTCSMCSKLIFGWHCRYENQQRSGYRAYLFRTAPLWKRLVAPSVSQGSGADHTLGREDTGRAELGTHWATRRQRKLGDAEMIVWEYSSVCQEKTQS